MPRSSSSDGSEASAFTLSEYDHAPLDRLAVQVANTLEQRERLVPGQHFHGKQAPKDPQTGG